MDTINLNKNMSNDIANLNNSFAVIPARSGSKGLPGKNLKKLCGRELFQWSVDAAKFLNVDYVVSTDDKNIIKLCKKRNINFIVRPSELCQDNSGDYDFLKHTIQELDLIAKNKKSIINLRPTSPLRLKSDLVRFSKKLIDAKDSMRSVIISDFPAQKMWYLNDKYLSPIDPNVNKTEEFNMARQLLKKSYKQTGAFDSYMISDILSGSINGDKIMSFVQNGPMADIDKISDLEKAENILSTSDFDFV
jgi:CMP-N-acetylneuraminic acid synthetase